ncbi:MAG: CoA-binding protein [Candidatus Cyclonatronum sp.]|uniref:CoA-binding protein n=1 Tax=Cyclonatronum sp. TaxID=3024185 RepID=UPI0025BE5996|nr:CoA-binding protein [Cyclonatronum sp.]MCH8487918.1 CoA-binding protein [Cyclonatronum sp.]
MNSTFQAWYERKMYATEALSAETGWVQQFLPEVRTIAIVGLSKNPTKDSHFVGRYLQRAGYTIIPVNPTADEILGETCYPDLASVPVPVDVVNVFMKPALISVVVEAALETEARVIWLQLGTGEHPELSEKVSDAGRRLIQKRCIKADHQFLVRDLTV